MNQPRINGKFSTVHGLWKTRTHRAWEAAKRRCTVVSAHNWRWYGANGITMCDKWSRSFTAFLQDMGKCPAGLTLDRIDGHKGYYPGNCRWATWEEQRENRLHPYGGANEWIGVMMPN